MKRVVIIKRTRWIKSRGGGHTTEDYQVLKDLTDKKLAECLEKMNEPYRSNFWEIVHDFKLSKKKDQGEYLKYCIDSFIDPYCKDVDSSSVGKEIFDRIFVS